VNLLIAYTYRLRHTNYHTSIILTVLAFVLCVALYALGYNFTHEGSILVIPVAFAAWFFKRYETWICLSLVIVAIACINTFAYSVLWPSSLLLAFLASSFILLLEAIFVRVFRIALDESEVARQMASEAQVQMQKAYQRQIELNELKDQFILNVNHELRTPLTEVFGYLELLHDPQVLQNEHIRDSFIDNAAHGCEELRYLIDSILDTMYSDSKLPVPVCEFVPLRNAVVMTLEQFDPRKLASHPVQLDIPNNLTAWADRRQVQQILRNLISNALKYSPPQTSLHFKTSIIASNLENHALRHVCISIHNEGMGIPREYTSLLFERFVRLPRDIASKQRGSGLGLYVSKQLVEGMGGKIWVESSGIEHKGNTFSFTLPSTLPVVTTPTYTERQTHQQEEGENIVEVVEAPDAMKR
jgi:signal transduction histidine kinase